MLGNTEDCMTKIVRLIANLTTDEENTNDSINEFAEEIQTTLQKCIEAISRKTLE